MISETFSSDGKMSYRRPTMGRIFTAGIRTFRQSTVLAGVVLLALSLNACLPISKEGENSNSNVVLNS